MIGLEITPLQYLAMALGGVVGGVVGWLTWAWAAPRIARLSARLTGVCWRCGAAPYVRAVKLAKGNLHSERAYRERTCYTCAKTAGHRENYGGGR